MISEFDKNFTETYLKFEKCVNDITEGSFHEGHLDTAKLSAFKSIDKPTLSHNLGLDIFQYGITQELSQTRRERLLEVSKDDIIDVANRYLLSAMEKDETHKVILGQNTDKLEMFVKNGWKIERFVAGLSLNQHKYKF